MQNFRNSNRQISKQETITPQAFKIFRLSTVVRQGVSFYPLI
ncbi:hypothetical protein M104_4982 [Bacteroides fragilis str. 1007-1-F |uniref:Uncharacterized protein n=1 Tax=Bacteroides fragilis str. 1007-1-F \|nr:hypothetical protein M104_4982 [Bacteroides fragilis str. 1007-1-F \